MAETKILGIVSIVPMGDWNADTEYQKLNFVRFNGATYLAKAPNINVAPGINAGWQDVWMLGNYDGGQQTVVPDGTYPEMTVGKVQYALMWGSKSYDGSSPQTITAEDLGIASVYKPQGSIEFAMLPAIPSQETEGYIWNITDNFTTDSRFLEGAGISYSAGTNVGVVQNDGAYYYDVFGNFVDLSDYAKINGTYPEMTVGNATNVTTQINGKFITDIFETDGTTVKTATNCPKSLYNLGAYDTYVDNGDGTVTVTRKTGKYDVPIENFVVGEGCFQILNFSLPNTDKYFIIGGSSGSSEHATSNVYPLGGWRVDDTFYIPSDNYLRVFDSSYTKDTTGLAQFKASLEAAGGMYILYETTTSYTEKLPANVPINILDANMSDIVRDEVEKTLNLAETLISSKTYNSGINGIDAVSIVKVKPGSTYTISYTAQKTSGIEGYGGIILLDTDSAQVPSSYSAAFADEGAFDRREQVNISVTISHTMSNEYLQVLMGGTGQQTQTIVINNLMINEGSHAYPYVPYSGQIVHQGDPDMEFATSEWEKALNLAPWNGTEDYTTAGNAWKYLFIAKVDIGKNYYFTINNFTQSRVGYGGLFLCQNDTTEIPVLYQNLIGSEYQIQTWEYSANGNLAVNFTPSKEYVLLGFSTDGSTKTIHVEDIMLVEGSHAYPYQPYNGAIVHEKQLNDALEDYLPLTGGTINGTINATGQVQEAGQRVYSPNNPQTTIAHADNATKATQDSDGNTIIDTYQKVHHLYEHKISLRKDNGTSRVYAYLTWISNKEDGYTRNEFCNELLNAGYTETTYPYPATGYNTDEAVNYTILGVSAASSTSIRFLTSDGSYVSFDAAQTGGSDSIIDENPRKIF